MNCIKICGGPKNTNKSIGCQLGYKHNPKSKRAALNLIKNGGKEQICLRNEWKFEQ